MDIIIKTRLSGFIIFDFLEDSGYNTTLCNLQGTDESDYIVFYTKPSFVYYTIPGGITSSRNKIKLKQAVLGAVMSIVGIALADKRSF